MKIYIYKITNKINGKIYIGQHKQTTIKENVDRYLGSGILIKKAQDKYGKENFTKEIVEYCNEEDVNDREVYWIRFYNSITPNGYNITKGGQNAATTQGAVVYNNGKELKYVKKGEQPPAGFVKGALDLGVEWRRSCSKANKGINNVGHVPWNKGKTKKDKIVQINAERSQKTTIEQGILKGENNPRALTYHVISPIGEDFIIIGGIKQFCKEHQLSYSMVKKYKNSGPCPYNKNNVSEIGKNTVGWSFNIIKTDAAKEARKRRNKLYKKLYEDGKLTKRQQNINKLDSFLN